MAAVRGGRGRPGGRPHLAEGEAPGAHVAAEGKKFIRDLVARQTSTAATLQQQQARGREFRRASAVLPLGDVSSGASSLQDFAASAERARRTEELAASGLPLEELRLLLEHESGKAAARLSEPEKLAREERVRDIQRRLASPSAAPGRASDDAGAGPSRHVLELGSALRLRQDSQLSPFVRLALDHGARGGAAEQDETPDNVPRFREAAPLGPHHPAHRLAALERDVFGHLDAGATGAPPPSATSRKRRRQRQAVDNYKERGGGGGGGGGERSGGGGGSLWDVRDPGPAQAQRRPTHTAVAERRPHGPARPKQYTVVDGSIVQLDARAQAAAGDGRARGGRRGPAGRGELVFVATGAGALSQAELDADRLSVGEVRQLPRFAAYEEGTPSAVLFVKNLDASVTEDDLAAVFGSFQRAGAAPTTFRLCGGRMRGQAFVTFPSVGDAGAALRGVVGYRLKGRPVVVQYGRPRGAASAAGTAGAAQPQTAAPNEEAGATRAAPPHTE